MRFHDDPAATFAELLAELLFGDERDESLEQTLEKTVSPTFAQRINGHVYHRDGYLDHVRDMRRSVTGGEVTVLEELGTDDRVAGRYLFRAIHHDGDPARYECHIFAQFAADGRIARMCEIARAVEDGDDADLLTIR